MTLSNLSRAWSRETSSDPEGWSTLNRAWGQCAVTSLVVQDVLGGFIVRAVYASGTHYWNAALLGAGYLDLTAQQFGTALPVWEGVPAVIPRERLLANADTVRRYYLLLAGMAELGGPHGG